MPFADYKDFKDCVAKNKDKDSPDAYCGYIKHQVEGGKKKEEVCVECEEHEAYHLEEEVKRMEEAMPYPCEYCSLKFPSYEARAEHMGIDHPDKFPHQEEANAEEINRLRFLNQKEVDYGLPPDETAERDGLMKKLYPNVGKEGPAALGEEGRKEPHTMWNRGRLPRGAEHTLEKVGGPEALGAPESELEKAKAEFLDTLTATVDLMTVMAKDTGYMSVSEKVSPTKPTYMYEVKQPMADVFVKQAGGLEVKVNWFNESMAELQDIVKSANKFFTDAGWNSKEVVREYEKHKKKWGKDWD